MLHLEMTQFPMLSCVILVREQLKELTKQYDKSENDLKALQSVGQVFHFHVAFHTSMMPCNMNLFVMLL